MAHAGEFGVPSSALDLAPVLEAVQRASPNSVLNAHAARLRATTTQPLRRASGSGRGTTVRRSRGGPATPQTPTFPWAWPPLPENSIELHSLLTSYGALLAVSFDDTADPQLGQVSVFVLADISVHSPRKLLIFGIKDISCRSKISKDL